MQSTMVAEGGDVEAGAGLGIGRRQRRHGGTLQVDPALAAQLVAAEQQRLRAGDAEAIRQQAQQARGGAEVDAAVARRQGRARVDAVVGEPVGGGPGAEAVAAAVEARHPALGTDPQGPLTVADHGLDRAGPASHLPGHSGESADPPASRRWLGSGRLAFPPRAFSTARREWRAPCRPTGSARRARHARSAGYGRSRGRRKRAPARCRATARPPQTPPAPARRR